MALKVTIEKRQDGVLVVSLAGSIDSDTYAEFEKKVTAALGPSTRAVVFNMEGVTYVSSIGFGMIFKIKQALEKDGGTLAIANLQPDVKKIFDAVKVIPESLFATMEAADEYLDAFIARIHKKSTEE